jgi:hypothetical protein
MLASINPLGERARRQNYPVTAGAYIASSTLAAGVLGAVLGAVGRPVARPTIAVPVIVLIAGVGLACDARIFGWRVPGPRRQVNENWLATYRGWVYGVGFGAQLGAAFTTIVSASATWVAFACALLSGSAARGAFIGATFGLVRAVPILLTMRVREPSALYACVRRIGAVRPTIARLTTGAQFGAILILSMTVVGAAR